MVIIITNVDGSSRARKGTLDAHTLLQRGCHPLDGSFAEVTLLGRDACLEELFHREHNFNLPQ